ncbi:heavy metal-binding domain-containing protein [Falsiroseomonas sp. CW058]|uniref:heavy metal-binding domain-containing protein n=1 Tax=Falsiroseomonas sp. CW058 TaxID=3388664 RepID=UPI003D31064F
MHPQIRQPGPGSRPICGMALEPEMPTAGAGPNPELADLTRRFRIGLALTVPVFLLEMGGHLTGMMHLVGGPRVGNWIQLLLATPVVLWAGWPFFERGWRSLVTRSLNMFTLIALGTGVAWVFSVVATLAPGIFPAAFRAPDGSVAVCFEAAAVIVVLVLLGQVLESRVRERTGGAIRALLNLAPAVARRIRPDGAEEEIPLGLQCRGRAGRGGGAVSVPRHPALAGDRGGRHGIVLGQRRWERAEAPSHSADVTGAHPPMIPGSRSSDLRPAKRAERPNGRRRKCGEAERRRPAAPVIPAGVEGDPMAAGEARRAAGWRPPHLRRSRGMRMRPARRLRGVNVSAFTPVSMKHEVRQHLMSQV